MNHRMVTALFATTALTIAVPAFAQDEQDPQEAADAADAIVVTGTRIVRDGYTAPTPVTVATVEDLVKSTPSNIPDALNKLPQFQNSLSPGKSANNFSNFPIHGNVLNLRGLGTVSNNPKGPLRTLILMDGIRVAPTTFIGTIDTNVIPNLLVERVDVVTGGASAAWGSDAVAGVVNFILNKDFTGLKGVAQAGVAERGYGGNQKLGAAFGTGFGGDRGHLLLSAEYYSNDGMRRGDRKIGRDGYTYVGSTVGCVNTTTNPTACSPGGSLNPLAAVADINITTHSAFGKIFAAGNPYNGFKLDRDGNLSPFNAGTATGTPGFNIGGDGYRIPDSNHTVAPFKTYQGFGRLSYDVADGVNVYAQATVSRSDLSYDPLANSFAQAAPTVTIYEGNPYIPAPLAATLAPGGSFGFSAYWGNEQSSHVDERTDFWQATAGVDADLGNWKASLSYTHADSRHKMDQSGLWNWRNTLAAVDVVSVNGVPTCRVLTTSFASAFAGCKPLDLFHGAPINTSPEGYAYATGTSSYRASFKHDSVVGTLSGSLFDLPAGPLDVVVGAEYRHQSFNLTSNADPATLDTAAERNAYFAGVTDRGLLGSMLYYWLTNVGTGRGSLSVKEVFGEVAVPILANTPGAEELSLNGAVRLTDYSTSGSVTTWKIGGVYKPISDVLLRATYSRDIRAPNLYELFRGDQSGIGIVLDPVTGLNQNASTVSGGNVNLKPEVAKTLTIGGVLQPSFMQGFSFAVDYYRIKLKGAIDSLSSAQILNNCYTFGPNTPECALITRPSPNEFPSLIRISEANIAFLNTTGIDFDASYRTQVGNSGALSLRLYANYLDKFDTQAYAGQPVIHWAGKNVVGSNPVAYPRWRGSLSVDYSTEHFGITLTEQYIGKMTHVNAGNVALSNFVNPTVGSVVYTDLSLRWIVPHNDGKFEFFTTVNNLFDKDPPIIPGTVPGVNLPTNISTYDVIGRAFTAGVRFQF
ncbi:MAG: TonB-dependent receptor [Novosphingobium sp.]|nr:TonB-dependent receptor [Novosphingobium sp.]